MSSVVLTIGSDGVALITLDVEGRPMNVLTPEFRAELREAIDRVATDDTVRGAVITSAKKTFMAGADLKDIAVRWGQFTYLESLERSQATSSLYRHIETCGKPVAAAINGLALGGGFELCLACHYRVLLSDARAVVGLPEITVGLLPGAGGTQRLPRLIDPERALDLLLSGKPVPPEEALRLGLVHALAAAEELVSTARHWVLNHPRAKQSWDMDIVPSHLRDGWFDDRLARIPATVREHYPASQAILSSVREGIAVSFDEGLAIESRYFAALLSGPVAQNIVRTMFVNKGNAERIAKSPGGVTKSEIKRVMAPIVASNKRFEAAMQKAGIVMVEDANDGDCDLAIVFGDRAIADAPAMQVYEVPGLAPLIEIVPAPSTSEETLARSLDLAGRLRMTPIVTRAARGLVARMREAFDDEVSRSQHGRSDPWDQALVLHRVALVAAQALERAEIGQAADADLASVFGAGYPSYTGGALSFADTQGIESFVAECARLAGAYGHRFAPSPWLVERARNGQQFHGARRLN